MQTFTLNGVDMTRYAMGPRTVERRRTYAKRRALLGGPDGRNPIVDMCRALTARAMVRRANLDRKRGVRR